MDEPSDLFSIQKLLPHSSEQRPCYRDQLQYPTVEVKRSYSPPELFENYLFIAKERDPEPLASLSLPFPVIRELAHDKPTGVEIHEQRNLSRVKRRNGNYGGYRKDILTEILSGRDNVLLICEICEGIVREACLSSNGEQFCSCCELEEPLTEASAESKQKNRRTRVASRRNSNMPVREMVNSLKCSCPTLNRGCEWVGTLKNCEEHLATCGYVRCECQLECGKVLQRNEHKVHVEEECLLRNVECEHCDEDFKIYELSIHLDECPKIVMTCELCGLMMYREDMAQHTEQDCVEKEVECPFVKYECEVTSIKRKYLNQHLEEKRTEHLELKVNATEQKLSATEQKLSATELKLNTMEQKLTTIEKWILKQSEGENHQEEEVKIYMEDIKLEGQQIQQLKEQDTQQREGVQQNTEEGNQQRMCMDNQIIENIRMSAHINALCSISKITMLEWKIEDIVEFIQIDHLPEPRNVAGRNLNIYFLKKSIYVGYADTNAYHDSFSLKFLIRLFSKIKRKVVKEYACLKVGIQRKDVSRIVCISASDVEELSRTGSANKLILEMYITM